jgi:hypothetical protein
MGEVLVGTGLRWGIIRGIGYGYRYSARLQEEKFAFSLFPAMKICADRQGLNFGIRLAVDCVLE